MKKLCLLLLLVFEISHAQKPLAFNQDDKQYPQNYFRSPLDIPTELSGTFGELRGNHFHAGMDFKTQQQEGFEVFTVAKGYVSRIKISQWGYGKAIYITHPNGYTSVYAHLKKFNEHIENYVKEKQYQKESYEIELFPKKNELPVGTDEVIGFSGNTGGSFGPHLHFEIRDRKTENPINPLLFGYKVNDSIKPTVQSLYAFPIGENSHVNKLGMKQQLNSFISKKGVLKTKTLKAFGEVGFGVSAFDLFNDENKNGIYSLKMYVNGKKVHDFEAKTFSFSKTKFINLLIDYEIYKTKNQRIQKCFVEPANKIGMYNPKLNGVLNIEEGKKYNVVILATDFAGNFQKVKFSIQGEKASKIIRKKEVITPYKIQHQIENKFSVGNATITFPTDSFYEDVYLNIEKNDTITKIHTATLPLRKKYHVSFDVSKYPKETQEKMFVAYINTATGRKTYRQTRLENNTLHAKVKELGDYILQVDNTPPKITFMNLEEEEWVGNQPYLEINIEDNESGIASYRATINGEWILMEYESKENLLSYDFKDLKLKTKHLLEVTIKDKVGNTTTVKRTFYKKNYVD